MSGEGKLSIVGTPIGNLSDASSRMVEVLFGASAILCEDTRVTSKLLAHFGVQVPLERCDENVIRDRSAALVERIAQGEQLVFVSDAGMPCISDPGQVLVDAVLDAGLHVEVIPGPSAVSSAIALSGLRAESYFFAGFFPRKAGEQERLLSVLASIPAALVFYESPRRLEKSLSTIAAVLPTRRVALCRELTKLHEEVVRGVAQELVQQLEERGELKGECVLVVEAPTKEELQQVPSREAISQPSETSLEDAIAQGLALGEAPSALAKRLSKERKLPREEVYSLVVEQSKK